MEAILDPVNLISAEHVADQDEEINKAFRLYGDRISVVHVKDFVMKEGKPEFAHVGEGLFHYEPLMKNLKKTSLILQCFWKIPQKSGIIRM